MKILRLALILLLTGSATALHAQEIVVGVDFDTFFDNREFGSEAALPSGTPSDSGTTFAARLTPWVGLNWQEKNSLVFGVDLFQNFGEKTPGFVSEVKPIMYYQFQTQNVRAAAGIFTREITHCHDYSVAFFTPGYQFVTNRMNGFMGQYNSGASYVEFILDWEGMFSTETREKFRILSSGRHFLGKFYYGYNLTLLHYAKKKNNPYTNIVDFLLVNPAVGMKFNAYFDFDIKLGLLQTMQRDRVTEQGWKTPRMGEFAFKMSRWGVTLDEQLYFGQNIYPFYGGHIFDDGTAVPYGHDVYPGVNWFYSAKHFYNRASIGYDKWFFNKTLGVRAAFITHYDGHTFGTQQVAQVTVRFFKTVYNSKNHKK